MPDTSSQKPCKDCGVTKPLAAYYKHKMMADGHLNSCKECKKAYQVKHREENVEAAREYDRVRHQEQPQRREHVKAVAERARKLRPEAFRAKSKVNDAIRRVTWSSNHVRYAVESTMFMDTTTTTLSPSRSCGCAQYTTESGIVNLAGGLAQLLRAFNLSLSSR